MDGNNNNTTPINVYPDKKYCLKCKKKTPPVETLLIVGVNITVNRWNRSAWYCNDCYKEMQKDYREFEKGRFTEYERIKEEEDIQKFEQEWNDPEFRNVKETSDKMVMVWNKYQRREPSRGLMKDVCCSVMFKDFWYISAQQVIDDLIKSRNDTHMIQNRHREILFLYIPSVLDAFRETYRQKARNKWDGLIDSVNSKYASREKLVAYPSFKDPESKRLQKRWYLLSYEQELKERNERNENKKRRIDFNMDREAIIVGEHDQKEREIRDKEKSRQENNSNTATESDKDKNDGIEEQ